MNIVIINSKGGASKSTTAYQVASTYFLYKNEEVELFELDNQNKDSSNFKNSEIKSSQIQVDFDKQLNNTIRDLFLNQSKNKVVDVGGNQTTTQFISAINQTKMYNLIDLFIIPMQKTGTFEHSFRKHLNSVYTFI